MHKIFELMDYLGLIEGLIYFIIYFFCLKLMLKGIFYLSREVKSHNSFF